MFYLYFHLLVRGTVPRYRNIIFNFENNNFPLYATIPILPFSAGVVNEYELYVLSHQAPAQKDDKNLNASYTTIPMKKKIKP